MVSMLHNIMWSIEKKIITHKAKGKNNTSIWALLGQDDISTASTLGLKKFCFVFSGFPTDL